jgi:hypothetical protein
LLLEMSERLRIIGQGLSASEMRVTHSTQVPACWATALPPGSARAEVFVGLQSQGNSAMIDSKVLF